MASRDMRQASGYGRPSSWRHRCRAHSAAHRHGLVRAQFECGASMTLAVAAFFLFLFFLGEATDARRMHKDK